MSNNTDSCSSRRAFVKSIGSISIGTVSLSVGVTAEPGDKADQEVQKGDSFEDRIRKSDPQGLYETYSQRYSPKVAKKVKKIWQHYTQAVLNGELKPTRATQKTFAKIKKVSPALRQDLKAAQTEVAQATAEPGTKVTVEAPAVNIGPSIQDSQIVEPQDNQELLLIDGAVGGSGVGFRDSNYYLDNGSDNNDILTSIVEVTPVGTISQWAEFQGNFYVGTGGPHRVTADYLHRGLLVGGTASYQMWIQPRGSSGKTFFTFRSPKASVYGNEARSIQMDLADDQVYDFGFRLTTAINGIADALVDYQTLNGGGSTRQLRLDSLKLEPIETN